MIRSMVPWHRILGLALTDLFTGSPFEVEMEKDLSARKQLLDIAIVRKTGPGSTTSRGSSRPCA